MCFGSSFGFWNGRWPPVKPHPLASQGQLQQTESRWEGDRSSSTPGALAAFGSGEGRGDRPGAGGGGESAVLHPRSAGLRLIDGFGRQRNSRSPTSSLLWRSSLTCQGDGVYVFPSARTSKFRSQRAPRRARLRGFSLPRPLTPHRAWPDTVRSEEGDVQTEGYTFASLCPGARAVPRLPGRGCCLL